MDGTTSKRGGEAMSGDTTSDVTDLIERLRQGDDSARKDLVERVVHRLHEIASSTLYKEFPRLRVQHDTGSVVHETWMRLMKALETYHPESAEEFYSLMFHKVRQVLLDMARRQTRHDARFQQVGSPGDAGESDASPGAEPSDSTHDPSRLAFWTEFHREVGCLPGDQRAVFDLHYFAGFTQAEIARLLGLPPKQVSRLWLAATTRLARQLDGLEELIT
jgi:RNA polymerase sigma factor (sigma-70 family)